MKEETGVDSVMVARGALGNPCLFSRYNSIVDNNIDPGLPDISEVKETALEHCQLLRREYGDVRALNFIKKNFIWYYKYYNGINELIDLLMGSDSVEATIDLLHLHTEKIIEEKYPEEDLDVIQQKFRMKVLFWLIKEPVFSESFG
jgi:tRNA-dihydrouridine synthase B